MKKVKMKLFEELNFNKKFLMIGIFNENGILEESFSIPDIVEATIDNKMKFDDFLIHKIYKEKDLQPDFNFHFK